MSACERTFVNLRDLSSTWKVGAGVRLETFLTSLYEITKEDDQYLILDSPARIEMANKVVTLHRAGYLVVRGDCLAERWILSSFMDLRRGTCKQNKADEFWAQCGEVLFSAPDYEMKSVIKHAIGLVDRDGKHAMLSEIFKQLPADICNIELVQREVQGVGRDGDAPDLNVPRLLNNKTGASALVDRVSSRTTVKASDRKQYTRSKLDGRRKIERDFRNRDPIAVLWKSAKALMGETNRIAQYERAKRIANIFIERYTPPSFSEVDFERLIKELRRISQAKLTLEMIYILGREASFFVYCAERLSSSTGENTLVNGERLPVLNCSIYLDAYDRWQGVADTSQCVADVNLIGVKNYSLAVVE